MGLPKTLKHKNVAAGTATTVISANPGFLHCITINTKGASSNTLTVYDNASAASGTIIALIGTTGQEQTLIYDVNVVNGITCASATGTGADYTVSFTN